MLLSVIVPMFNEQEVAERTYRKLESVLQNIEHELIFINDGSNDNTREIIEQLIAKSTASNTGSLNKIVNFSRNFGHQAAFSAGLQAAKGDAVTIIDGDLQDPPELILEMLEKWREGYQVVYARRKSRAGESWFKKITAKMFYVILHKLASIDIPPDTGDFRLMDKCVVEQINALPERSRFLRGLVCWVGYKRIGILYDRAERVAGSSKYPLRKMLKFALDGITSFSSFPLRLSFIMGLIATAIALALAIWGIAEKIIHPITTTPGWASLIVAIVFLGGAQLMCIGILGEYIGRIYEEVKQRPLFIEDNSRPLKNVKNSAAISIEDKK